MDEEKQIRFSAGEIIGAGDGVRREYRCRFVRAGRIRAAGNRAGNIEIRPEALQGAALAGLFDQRAVFVDHAGMFDYPSVERLAGVTYASQWNEADQAIEGTIKLYSTPLGNAVAELLDEVLSEGAAGPDIGLSIVFWPEFGLEKEGDLRQVVDVRHVESVDLVFEPAADGRVLSRLSAALQPQSTHPEGGEIGVLRSAGNRRLGSRQKAAINQVLRGEKVMKEEASNIENPTAGVSTPEAGATPTPGGVGASAAGAAGAAGVSGGAGEAWLSALQDAGAQAIIQSSGLPAVSRERLAAGRYADPEAVRSAVEAERSYLARLNQDQVVNLSGPAPRGGQISMGKTGLEQLQAAFEALISGTNPGPGVAPLSGIREAYMLLSGDYEMTGLFHSERVYLASVDSSTMAGLVANALNKRVVNLFQEYPRWWERICTIEDFTNLQPTRWITLGGVPELPTVAEGAAYTELSWDDMTETANFVKKGGYLGITIEAIDKDDTRKIQAAPRALAQAAWMTLSKAISGIFTANAGVGPNLADGIALFAAGHSNLGAEALSYSSYVDARVAMRKQKELNSNENLGALTAPRYMLVPPDLELAALSIFAGETTSIGEPNVLAEGDYHDARMRAARDRVIVVDLWSDTNNWALVADPKLHPSIGLGFRYGRTPEIFSVASPTQGLVFTNDVLPVKVRFLFAAGPVDYRGLYKANVA